MVDGDLQRLIDACDQYADRQHFLLDALAGHDPQPAHLVLAQRAALEQLDAAIQDAHRALLVRRRHPGTTAPPDDLRADAADPGQ